MSKTLLADEPVACIPPPNCCFCGRFVNVKTAHRFVEQGDYGKVYSVEFACPNHDSPSSSALSVDRSTNAPIPPPT